MSELEVIIKDVEGDDLLVTWDLADQSDGAVVLLESLRNDCAILNLDGIVKLRAALDDAEAAYRERGGG